MTAIFPNGQNSFKICIFRQINYSEHVMIKEKIPQLKKLSKQEKRILAGELWDEAMDIDDIELTDDQKKLLDERIEYAKAHSEEMIPWQRVKNDLMKKYNG